MCLERKHCLGKAVNQQHDAITAVIAGLLLAFVPHLLVTGCNA